MDNERKHGELDKTLKRLSRIETVSKITSVCGMFAGLILAGYLLASSSITILYSLLAVLTIAIVSILVWHNVEKVWTLLEGLKLDVTYLEGRIKRIEGENTFIPTDPNSKVKGYDV